MEFRIEVAVKVYVGARIEAKCLSRNSHATPTFLPRSSHATPTQLPRNSHVQAGLQPACILLRVCNPRYTCFCSSFPQGGSPQGSANCQLIFPIEFPAQQLGYQRVAKQAELRCKTGRSAVRNSTFCNLKRHVLRRKAGRTGCRNGFCKQKNQQTVGHGKSQNHP